MNQVFAIERTWDTKVVSPNPQQKEFVMNVRSCEQSVYQRRAAGVIAIGVLFATAALCADNPKPTQPEDNVGSIPPTAPVAKNVVVDVSQYYREWPRVERYVATTIRYTAPAELGQRIIADYGKPEVIRAYITLDEMWDYRDDSYHFDYTIGKPRYGEEHYDYDWKSFTERGMTCYQYLQSMSDCAKYILLNCRRYEHEIFNNPKKPLTLERYAAMLKNGIKHYKQKFPNIKYIEMCNEYGGESFGKIKPDQYYELYKIGYRVVNEVNKELKPEIPLLIGGPAAGSSGSPQISDLITKLAEDNDTGKRLDFLSFHDYGWLNKDGPLRFPKQWVDLLNKHKLSSDIPFFLDEFGCFNIKDKPPLSLVHAPRIPKGLYLASFQSNLHVFPWCVFHDPKRQLVSCQYVEQDGGLKLTAYGSAIQAMTKHKKYEVAIKDGVTMAVPFYTMATVDHTGVAILSANPDGKGMEFNLDIRNLSELFKTSKFTIRKYLIDKTHSNCLENPKFPGGLEQVSFESVTVNGGVNLSCNLEPNALAFWLIEPDKVAAPLPTPSKKEKE